MRLVDSAHPDVCYISSRYWPLATEYLFLFLRRLCALRLGLDREVPGVFQAVLAGEGINDAGDRARRRLRRCWVPGRRVFSPYQTPV